MSLHVKAHSTADASTHAKSANALRLVMELYSLLLSYGEVNWIRSVSNVGALLQDNDLASAATSYKVMIAGNGSFCDFYIHADDLDVRRQLNEPLDLLRHELRLALDL